MIKLTMKQDVYADSHNIHIIKFKSPKDISHALNHEDWEVRLAAVESPHFKPEHMDRAMNDEDLMVRKVAKETPFYNEWLTQEKIKFADWQKNSEI